MSKLLKSLVELRDAHGYGHVASIKMFFMQGELEMKATLSILIPLISSQFPQDIKFEIL